MKKFLKYASRLLFLLFIIVGACKSQSGDNSNSMSDIDNHELKEQEMPDADDKFEIFGVTASNNEADILQKLQEKGLLKIDTLSLDDKRKFKFAIVEFASVKFGVNKGLVFLTSRSDKEAIDSLVSKISSFYGEPEAMSDFDDEEPQYKYYKWNPFDPEKPYILIRPVHSEEGGLTMIWNS